MAQEHAVRKHALLSASGSSRWLSCPPSARLEENEKESTSAYAEEGTLAHELAETGLRFKLGLDDQDTFVKKVAELKKSSFYNDDMVEEVQKYITFVLEEFAAAKAKTEGAIILLEERVDYSSYVEEGFGTNDSSIVADDVLQIIDLKFGKGISVDAEDNTQLMLYALGAIIKYDLCYDIKRLRLTIFQPRLDHYSSWELTVEELYEWGEKIVKPAAALAYEGKGEMKAGSHCKWCKVKARCRVLAEFNTSLASHDFAEPPLLSDEELIKVHEQAKVLIDWVNSVDEYLLKEALNGKNWPGYKLVEGRSVRKWTDENDVEAVLRDNGFRRDEYMKSSLKGITDIEKLVGKDKFTDMFSTVVEKPQGKPTLVPESDKRPAISNIDQAKSDFQNN